MAIRKHRYYGTCEDPNCSGECMLCNVSACKVCGLYEGSLTTECPGEAVAVKESDKIYNGEVDFRNGKWIPNMRNRFMYGDPYIAIRHEKRYLDMLLRETVQDFERIMECKEMIDVLQKLLDRKVVE